MLSIYILYSPLSFNNPGRWNGSRVPPFSCNGIIVLILLSFLKCLHIYLVTNIYLQLIQTTYTTKDINKCIRFKFFKNVWKSESGKFERECSSTSKKFAGMDIKLLYPMNFSLFSISREKEEEKILLSYSRWQIWLILFLYICILLKHIKIQRLLSMVYHVIVISRGYLINDWQIKSINDLSNYLKYLSSVFIILRIGWCFYILCILSKFKIRYPMKNLNLILIGC